MGFVILSHMYKLYSDHTTHPPSQLHPNPTRFLLVAPSRAFSTFLLLFFNLFKLCLSLRTQPQRC